MFSIFLTAFAFAFVTGVANFLHRSYWMYA